MADTRTTSDPSPAVRRAVARLIGALDRAIEAGEEARAARDEMYRQFGVDRPAAAGKKTRGGRR